MKRIILSVVAVMLLSACEVVVEPYHNGYSYGSYNQHGYCHEEKPYSHRPIQSHDQYDNYDHWYEGTCSIWLVNVRTDRRDYEEWCDWVDSCGWEFIASYTEYFSH
jgi:hypothetical protein